MAGDGCVSDDRKARQWYEKAATQGNVNAQFSIGKCNYEGTGGIKFIGDAIRWFEKAADKGEVEAQFYLGKCYWEELNPLRAVDWLKKAADKNVEAQFLLGECYSDGVLKDCRRSCYTGIA